MRKLITTIAVGALVANLPVGAAEPVTAPAAKAQASTVKPQGASAKSAEPSTAKSPGAVSAPLQLKAQTPVTAPVDTKTAPAKMPSGALAANSKSAATDSKTKANDPKLGESKSAETKTSAKGTETKTAKASDSKPTKTTETKVVRSFAPRRMMVPPPPPEIPLVTGMMGSSMEFSTLGMPIDLMSSADLEKVKTRLQTSLDLLIKRADQRTADVKEARDRVTQFEGLCTEGVVSKRDLNNARKELVLAESTDSDIDGRVADMKSDLARIDKKLKSLSGKKKTSVAKKPAK